MITRESSGRLFININRSYILYVQKQFKNKLKWVKKIVENQGRPAFYELDMTRDLMSLMGGRATAGIAGNFIGNRIYSGDLALLQLGNLLKESIPEEDKRVLIITDSFTKKFVKKVQFYLDYAEFEVKVWSGAEPEVPIPTIHEGVEICNEFKPRIFFAIGGGSVIDTAKILLIKYEKPEEDIYNIMPILQALGLKKKIRYLIAAPTTSGTGSEVTYAAVATDTERNPPKKLEVMHDELLPDIAILYPEFIKDMPPFLTAGTGLDALAHAVGAYIINIANPVTDALGTKAIEMILKYLPRSYKYGAKDIEARKNMQLAATMAGMSFGNCQTGIDHAMGHSFGKVFNIHHGIAVGLFMPYAVQFQSEVTEKWKDLCPLFGINSDNKSNEDLLKELTEKMKEFMKSIEAPTSIKDFENPSISRQQYMDNLDLLADYAYNDGVTLYSNRAIDVEVYKKIFEYVYDGKDIDF
ncbi:MAG: Aldehyde-alcohol dehydrogenase [Promethearchaeota archaeon]|nr:MAG: Aldehyde-alcohol dehydrogenase [Candidatus Lokiarchaeota archaeon]